MRKLEGTAMAELVEGGRLRRADILLVHSKSGFWERLIQFGTRNYWNHALVVYEVRNPNQGYETTSIIDPKAAGDVEIDNIAHYLERPGKYDVAVKRLEAEWFNNDCEADGLHCRNRVCEIAFGEIGSKQDSIVTWRFFRRILRQITLAYHFVWRKIRTAKKGIRLPPVDRSFNVSDYSCGGFVQWCYYKGVSQVLDEDGVDKSRLQEAVFNPRLAGQITEYELLFTTPADLASSDRLSWKYIIKDGVVGEVSSEEEVNLIINSGMKPE